MRTILWTLLALLALRLLPRALRREAAALRLIALLCELTAATIVNTSKAYGTEGRVTSVESRLGTQTVNLTNLQNLLPGLSTTSNGLPNGTISGQSGNNGLSDGTITGTSGSQSAGTAHTHSPGSYRVSNGLHVHDPGGYAVTNGVHSHNLPNPL